MNLHAGLKYACLAFILVKAEGEFMENIFDLGIIGAGPAGYTAALRAAKKR